LRRDPGGGERRLIALAAMDAGCPVVRSGDVRDPPVTEVEEMLGSELPT
jgi:hypothetical protein